MKFLGLLTSIALSFSAVAHEAKCRGDLSEAKRILRDLAGPHTIKGELTTTERLKIDAPVHKTVVDLTADWLNIGFHEPKRGLSKLTITYGHSKDIFDQIELPFDEDTQVSLTPHQLVISTKKAGRLNRLHANTQLKDEIVVNLRDSEVLGIRIQSQNQKPPPMSKEIVEKIFKVGPGDFGY